MRSSSSRAAFPKAMTVFHRVAILALELVDEVHAAARSRPARHRSYRSRPAARPGRSRDVFGRIIEVESAARRHPKACSSTCAAASSCVGGFAQQVHRAGRLIIAGKKRIALRDPLPDGGGVRQHLAAGVQRLLLAFGQGGILDLLHLIAQQVDLPLLFGLIGDDGIQLFFDLDQLPVNGIIRLKCWHHSAHKRPKSPRDGPGSAGRRSRAGR